MTAGIERLHLLNAYHNAARQLVDLLDQGVDLIDLDVLDGLFIERDRLISNWNELGGGPLNDEERVVAVEIQRLDAIAMTAMLDMQQRTRQKSSDMLMQRRGIDAYTGDYAYDAAFIDKRK